MFFTKKKHKLPLIQTLNGDFILFSNYATL